MRRSGFTLIEMMVVVVIISLVTLMAFPRMRGMMAGAGVRGAAGRVAQLFTQARAAAIQSGRPTALHFDGTNIYVTRWHPLKAGACQCDTVGAVQALGTEFKVTVSTTSNDIPLDPRGLAILGGPVNIVVARDGQSRTVQISQYGKVTQ